MTLANEEAIAAHMSDVVRMLTRRSMRGFFTGVMTPRTQDYMNACRFISHETGTLLLFTRDTEHHLSGWWKNPDYERCWHLSMSALPPLIIVPGAQRAELDRKTRDAWIKEFYGDETSKVWAEPPYSLEGKKRNVWHFRLFCDENWTPILPRKEVYTKEFTPRGWKSYSDLKAEEAEPIQDR